MFDIVLVVLIVVVPCALATMLDKHHERQATRVAEMLSMIDERNGARYAGLLKKLSVLRRQNDFLMDWANRQYMIGLHEVEGRAEIARELKRKEMYRSVAEDFEPAS